MPSKGSSLDLVPYQTLIPLIQVDPGCVSTPQEANRATGEGCCAFVALHSQNRRPWDQLWDVFMPGWLAFKAW